MKCASWDETGHRETSFFLTKFPFGSSINLIESLLLRRTVAGNPNLSLIAISEY